MERSSERDDNDLRDTLRRPFLVGRWLLVVYNALALVVVHRVVGLVMLAPRVPSAG